MFRACQETARKCKELHSRQRNFLARDCALRLAEAMAAISTRSANSTCKSDLAAIAVERSEV